MNGPKERKSSERKQNTEKTTGILEIKRARNIYFECFRVFYALVACNSALFGVLHFFFWFYFVLLWFKQKENQPFYKIFRF